MARKTIRNLIVVFGDQLNRDASAFDGFDPDRDAVWLAEVAAEANYAWSHKQRIALFFSAMRHFRNDLEADGIRVWYTTIGDGENTGKLSAQLLAFFEKGLVERVIATLPGEYRIRKGLETVCGQADIPLEIREDRHFFCSPEAFDSHVEGRKSLRMEFFYREMRKAHGVLMEKDDKDRLQPTGGNWNYDKANRDSFGNKGPGDLPDPPFFKPDAVTRAVLTDVERHFGDHPGSLESFRWPVTPGQAQQALKAFIRDRLPTFGQYQDAMWTGQPFLYHSLIASSLNLKLLDPRDVIGAAEKAWQQGDAPLAAVEGFIRQILGWREYVRGIYWRFMPEYLKRNGLDADETLPDFYWTGDTPMVCLRECIGQTLEHAYAHHIQRLMVTGLYGLMLGVSPQEMEGWYLAVYVDAVEWVTLPNTLGMSQYGDGGLMASKPYIATGKYIQRMSNYCSECRFNPARRTGEQACPFTTLYWDFLLRHEDRLRDNHRMSLQVRNINRLDQDEKQAIRSRARAIRKDPAAQTLCPS
ncbi:MAG: cryptochrome/photolyase family protein [Opitutales bacterium]